MAEWSQAIKGLREGKVVWIEDWSFEEVIFPDRKRQAAFLFYLEADRGDRPDKPWEILRREIARFDELVLRKQGIRAGIYGNAGLHVDEEEAERVQDLLVKWYGERIRIVHAGQEPFRVFSFIWPLS